MLKRQDLKLRLLRERNEKKQKELDLKQKRLKDSDLRRKRLKGKDKRPTIF